MMASSSLPVPESVDTVQGFLAQLYPFQADAVGFLITRKQGLLADEMGLGKTICSIAAALELRNHGLAQRILILCPKTILAQWANEIQRFTGEAATIIAGPSDERARSYLNAGFWVITNYETMLRDAKQLAELHPTIVVLDEAQRIGSYNAQTTRKIKTYLRPEYRWALTGTPIENGLDELHSILQWVNPFILPTWWSFQQQYLIYGGYKNKQIVGSKNLVQLHSQIKDWMLRRHKRDVLKDLPPVTVNNYYITLSPEERETYELIRNTLKQGYRRYRAHEQTPGEVLTQLTYLRECCDHRQLVTDERCPGSKLAELRKILDDVDTKVVVFTEYERMLHLIEGTLYGDVRFESLYGALTDRERTEAMNTFTSDPLSKVFLSTEAGGLGVNLQAASTLINYELPWNPARLQQRIGRLHRIGQQDTVTVINLVVKDSIEERVLKVIDEKSNLFRNIVDGDFSSVEHERAIWSILGAEFNGGL